jgi:hypothetical protein
MHLRRICIENIRSIRSLEWKLPETAPAVGWHVVIGDNGSGKSTFLRSVALALIGPRDALALRLPWDDWLSKGEREGKIGLHAVANLDFDSLAEGDSGPLSLVQDFGVDISTFVRSIFSGQELGTYDNAQIGGWDSAKGFWRRQKTGWFGASYGPFRRFTGGDPEFRYLSSKLPKVARFLSIFDERVALTECLEWLRSLKFKSFEMAERARPGSQEFDLLPAVIDFINQPDFLPFQARLKEITSEAVLFVDGNDAEVRVEDLSDGYRSILSMTFDLIRQLADAFGPSHVFDPDDPTRVLPEGVVLIDEVDVHLHPTWQRRVGFWFRKHFPNIQFIVTTHSPLVCPAAEVGSIFLLPRPGEDGRGEMLDGVRLKRLIDGNVLDAYGTEVFGEDVTRSESSKDRLRRLAELNVLELTQPLTGEQKKEQEELRAAMPTTAGVMRLDDDPDPKEALAESSPGVTRSLPGRSRRKGRLRGSR